MKDNMIYSRRIIEGKQNLGASHNIKFKARELRKNLTVQEKKLWDRIIRRQQNGKHFRKQHPYNIYILDFFCFEANLAIEVEGKIHLRKKEYDEAAAFMEKAAANMPESARIHYNYGLLLQFLKRDSEAEVELYKALSLEPENMDFLYALADYYLKRSNYKKAREFAEIMIKLDPDQPVGHDLLNIILKNQH